ncbi:1536_t:CDS:2 [Paraglomus brasilianum]|uniref:1536_t:CDS:1 n=1 Tax=Paraglomus brasilianum TaxID=144538 RepID=A0A9N8WGJ5_9GLOM|nr:1536_t:CDS:2 [Paraglomus brasilianum]
MRNLRLSHYYNIDPNDVYETRILIIVSIRALGASMNFRAYKVTRIRNNDYQNHPEANVKT